MTRTHSRPDDSLSAPLPFAAALAELVDIGCGVARMIGRLAEAEQALADAAAQAGVAPEVSAMANSLAEAIEADRAAAAAAESRHSVVARVEAIAGAFARTARSVRLTILLADRLDRGRRRGVAADRADDLADDRAAMARRQIVRGVEEAIAREAEGERAERMTEDLSERLESLDVEREILDRPVDEVIREICAGLGLDAARMVVRPPVPGMEEMVVAGQAALEPLLAPDETRTVFEKRTILEKRRVPGGSGWGQAPRRRPDG